MVGDSATEVCDILHYVRAIATPIFHFVCDYRSRDAVGERKQDTRNSKQGTPKFICVPIANALGDLREQKELNNNCNVTLYTECNVV